jgi:CheY-like chemotaxis protein
MNANLLVVVDDDEDVREDVGGCVPIGAIQTAVGLKSHKEFDKAIKRQRKFDSFPGIFFVDLRMESASSGMEILSFIRRSRRFKHVPVVIISNSEEESDILEAYMNGANMYLYKGDEPSDLPNAVKKLLEIWTSTGKLPAA